MLDVVSAAIEDRQLIDLEQNRPNHILPSEGPIDDEDTEVVAAPYPFQAAWWLILGGRGPRRYKRSAQYINLDDLEKGIVIATVDEKENGDRGRPHTKYNIYRRGPTGTWN